MTPRDQARALSIGRIIFGTSLFLAPSLVGRLWISEDADRPRFADGLRASQPDHGFRWHDLKTWLPGVEPGELAASPLNPRLYP